MKHLQFKRIKKVNSKLRKLKERVRKAKLFSFPTCLGPEAAQSIVNFKIGELKDHKPLWYKNFLIESGLNGNDFANDRFSFRITFDAPKFSAV